MTRSVLRTPVPFLKMGRAARWLALASLLAACGGGEWWIRIGSFSIDGDQPREATAVWVYFTGTSFVPNGASCQYQTGPFAPPGCNCELGWPVHAEWRNETTGQSGPLELTLIGSNACTPRETAWRTPRIGLAGGANSISFTISDDATRGGATVTVFGQ